MNRPKYDQNPCLLGYPWLITRGSDAPPALGAAERAGVFYLCPAKGRAMGRIRTVKPELAVHEGLYDLECELGAPVRFAWVMLFTACDREGRFAWRPRRLKAQILPFDDVDFSRVLDAWATRGFIVKYRVGDAWYGAIPTWHKHQVVNNRESPSELPPLEEADEIEARPDGISDACRTRAARVDDASATPLVHAQAEGKGREGKGNGKNTVPRKRGTNYSDAFEEFWKRYRKFPGPPQNGSKAEAYRRWKQELGASPEPETLTAIHDALTAQERYRQDRTRNGMFAAEFPHAEKWLKEHRWESVPDSSHEARPSGDFFTSKIQEAQDGAATTGIDPQGAGADESDISY